MGAVGLTMAVVRKYALGDQCACRITPSYLPFRW